MSEDPRVLELLDEVLESGRTPEEACAGAPELLADVRARLERLRNLESKLAELLPANPPAPEEGAELPAIAGYDVEAVLGRGGMGIVYKARHRELKRLVAIKMMLGGADAGPQARALFRREAEAIAGLQHPNFVQVHDVGEAGGRPFFAMEFVDGGTLADRLGGRPIPPREACPLVATIATAMHAAHRAGVVHRDLKPANVMLTSDGTPKITDFGLARRVEDDATLTSIGVRVGTPSYMAPEQASGRLEAIGLAADVYSLGAILYETLTGRPPFVGTSAAETEWHVVHDDPVPPTRLNRSVPRDLETIALKCLQKEPVRRYESADALSADLHRFERGEPIAARRAGRFERATKWARRRRAQALAVATTALLVAAIAGGTSWLGLERSAALRAADQDLQEAARREHASEWAEARGALSRAALRLGDRSATTLRSRLDEVRRELDLVERLGAIRLARALNPRADFDRLHCDRDYRRAFADAGLIADLDSSPEAIAATGRQIAATDVRAGLVAALDDWSMCVNSKGEQQRLLQLASFADPDPRWRDRLRNSQLWSDPPVLDQLVRDVDVARESVTVLTLFAWVLENFGRDHIGIRKRTQQAHAGDFWASFNLAESLDARDDPDAIGFYRAALALRPTAVAAQVNLGVVLAKHGRQDEAIDCWQRALTLDPAVPTVHFDLGIADFNSGNLAPALAHFQEAVRLDPDFGRAHAMLGQTLHELGQFADAEPHFRRSLDLAGTNPQRDFFLDTALKGLKAAQRAVANERRFPDLLAGREVPADAADALEIAAQLSERSWFVPAAEFFQMAFAEQPALADDLESGIRWTAATAALLAGSDRDLGELGLDDDERVLWRKRALEWLRADLAAVTSRLAQGPAANDVERMLLSKWREDPDFAAVREPDALAALPSEERELWSGFWRDVDAQLARAFPPR